MKEQTSIPKHKFSRAAALTKTGVKIGANYAKYYGKKAFTGADDREQLHEENAADSYDTLSKLKGGPLKVAQMLSIDKNLLPSAYADQFSQAHYSAPPLSYPLVVQTFKREFGKSPTQMFDTFTQKAVSGASIGQVHKATLAGKNYAVKVQYPGIAESLKSDLRMVKPFAVKMFNLDATAVAPYFQEVEERLLEETDYSLELKRAQQLSRPSANAPDIRYPQYYPKLSSTKILTMEWMDGVTLDKFADSNPPADSRDHIGQSLWDFYNYQVHELNVFHADPHPGNFLVHEGQLTALDFGCVKEITHDFYLQFFALLSQKSFEDKGFLLKQLKQLEVILPGDTPQDEQLLLDLYSESVELLSRPFHCDVFDFGNQAYLEEIYQFGERNKANKELQKLNNARGSADALYVNRAYFGLYNLMARLKAKIKAELPDFLAEQPGDKAVVNQR